MITFKAEGIEAALANFKTHSIEAQADIQAALNDWADRTARDAKQLVSANSSNEGMLLNSIHPVYGNGTASVVASVKYAAYIEFGTRKYAAAYVSTLPADWSSYAATFKGKAGGDYYDFLNAILDWVISKGITATYSIKTKRKDKNDAAADDRLLAAATAIAFEILKNGIKPKPFLYPSVNKNLPLLMQDIKAIFK
jgi:hypothetical protein